VHSESLTLGVRASCDSADALVRLALRLDLRRENGRYNDSFRGTPRVGCRLSAEGSFSALPDSAGPVGAIEGAFERHGWRSDLRYMGDGPDGSDVGVRRRDMLCLILGRWEGDDEEKTGSPPTEEADRYQVIVECSREVASHQDAGVPDSIWHAASAAGLDRLYAISLSLQYPPCLPSGKCHASRHPLPAHGSASRRRPVGRAA
jgi:hypothetical protein